MILQQAAQLTSMVDGQMTKPTFIMKRSNILATLVILGTLAAGGLAISQTANENRRMVIITEGTPTVMASQGTLATDKSSGALWVKTGGESTNGWAQLFSVAGSAVTAVTATYATTAGAAPIVLSANQTAVAGALKYTTNGFDYYMTTNSGLRFSTNGMTNF